MLTRFLWGLAGCLLVAALVATAGAQEKGQKGRGRGPGGPGFFGGGGSLVMLASNEAVQKEIGADEATVGKIRSIGEESRQAMGEIFAGGGQDLSDEERQKRREKFEELSKKSAAKLKEALSADQFKRLQQISWQAAGAAALADETVAKELAITEEQKKKLADVRDDYAQKRQALGRDAAPEARRELAQEESKKAIEVLTAEQQEKFTALKGKAFDVAALRGGFGGGRPGGKGKNRPKTE